MVIIKIQLHVSISEDTPRSDEAPLYSSCDYGNDARDPANDVSGHANDVDNANRQSAYLSSDTAHDVCRRNAVIVNVMNWI